MAHNWLSGSSSGPVVDGEAGPCIPTHRPLYNSCLSSPTAPIFFLAVYLWNVSSSEQKLLSPLCLQDEDSSACGELDKGLRRQVLLEGGSLGPPRLRYLWNLGAEDMENREVSELLVLSSSVRGRGM